MPLLVVDFDDTLTQGDTIGTLIDAAIAAQARDVADGDEHAARRAQLAALKARLVSEYVDAFQGILARHLPPQGLARERGLDMEVASGFLDALDDFEQRMTAKVADSGILAGLQARLPIPSLASTVAECCLEPAKEAQASVYRRKISSGLQSGWHCGRTRWRRCAVRSTVAGQCTCSLSTGPPRLSRQPWRRCRAVSPPTLTAAPPATAATRRS